MNMPKLYYFFNFRKDLSYVKHDFPVFKKIFGKYFFIFLHRYYPQFNMSKKYTNEKFIKFLKTNKKIILPQLEKKSEELIKSWKNVEKKFFRETERKFGKWNRKKYYCHFSSTYICGGGYRYPTIIIFPFSSHTDLISTICHEMLHIHVIEDIKKYRLKPKNYFQFSEVAVSLAMKEINCKIYFPNLAIKKLFQKILKKIKKEKITEWKEKLFFISKFT